MRSHRFLYVNPAAAAILQQTPEALLGKSCHGCLTATGRPVSGHRLGRTVSNEENPVGRMAAAAPYSSRSGVSNFRAALPARVLRRYHPKNIQAEREAHLEELERSRRMLLRMMADADAARKRQNN